MGQMIKRIIVCGLVLCLCGPAFASGEETLNRGSAIERLKAWEAYRRSWRQEQMNSERQLLESWAEIHKEAQDADNDQLLAQGRSGNVKCKSNVPSNKGPGPGRLRPTADATDDYRTQQLN